MMRIDKLLSNLKYGSRKDVERMIKQKRVFVNGLLCTSGKEKVDPRVDEIMLDQEIIFYEESILLMMNKPAGYVSANHDDLHPTVFDFVKEPYNRFDLNIAGRLDIDTEGLLLLTNDGQLLHEIIHPKKNVYKEYYVEVAKSFDFACLLKSMEILDGNGAPYRPMRPIIKKIDERCFYLKIKEGKFHQIKRMVEHCGSEVVYLKRTKVGHLSLDEKMKPGELMEVDIEQIKS